MSDPLLIFRSSISRIHASGSAAEAFYNDFYDAFMASDERISAMFTNVNLARQKSMLRYSLMLAANFYTTRQINDELKRYRQVHGPRGLKVPSELYQTWLDALLRAVVKHDPQANDDTVLAWQVALAPTVAFMSAPTSSDEWRVPSMYKTQGGAEV